MPWLRRRGRAPPRASTAAATDATATAACPITVAASGALPAAAVAIVAAAVATTPVDSVAGNDGQVLEKRRVGRRRREAPRVRGPSSGAHAKILTTDGRQGKSAEAGTAAAAVAIVVLATAPAAAATKATTSSNHRWLVQKLRGRVVVKKRASDWWRQWQWGHPLSTSATPGAAVNADARADADHAAERGPAAPATRGPPRGKKPGRSFGGAVTAGDAGFHSSGARRV